jgi:chromosome segregation ATPase
MTISPTKERMTLMERQALETGDAPMLATLRISELDKLVARVKQRQKNCMTAKEYYEKELYHLEKEVASIMVRYTPLVERLQVRQKERQLLQEQYDQVAKRVGNLLQDTKQRLRNSSHQQLRTLRHEATAELQATRGYSFTSNHGTTKNL